MRNELSHVATTAKDVAVGFVAASVGMSLISTGGVMVGRAFQGIVSSIFDMNATLETSTLQFKTLTGSAEVAQAHVKMLFQIAKETPFETGPIIAASQSLEAFGGAALNTQKNILMIGDAAAATGSPIQELGFWVGRLYSSLAAGKPFGEAAQRLQELKVLTPEARMAMEKLQETGGSTAAAWEILTTSFGKFEGGMKEQATTWQGLVSTFTDGANMLVGAAFKPVFEAAKTALGGINDFIDENGDQWSTDMRKSVQNVIEALGGVPESADPVGEFLKNLPGWIDGTAEPMKKLIADVGELAARAKTLAGLADGVGDFFRQFGQNLNNISRIGELFGGGSAGTGRSVGGADQAWLDLIQQRAEDALSDEQSAAAGRLASAQAARLDAATALENARGAGTPLSGNFAGAGDEAAARRAAAELEKAAKEYQREQEKLAEVERKLIEAANKAEESINIGIDTAAITIGEAQARAATAVEKLKEEFDFSASIRAEMDKLNDAVRVGMRAMNDSIAEGQRNTAAQREMFDIGTSISRDAAAVTRSRGREDLNATIGIQRAREDLAEAHARRIRDITRQGGPGMGSAIAAENRSFAEQTQQQAKQESRAYADRQRARANQDADRMLALQLAAEDRALRDARAASDREQQTVNEKMLTIEQARLELPIKQLESAVVLRGLNQQIADAYKAQEDTINKANEALTERIRLADKELQLTRQRLGIMSAAGDDISEGGSAGGMGSFSQHNTVNVGIIGTEDVIEHIIDSLAEEGLREVRAGG